MLYFRALLPPPLISRFPLPPFFSRQRSLVLLPPSSLNISGFCFHLAYTPACPPPSPPPPPPPPPPSRSPVAFLSHDVRCTPVGRYQPFFRELPFFRFGYFFQPSPRYLTGAFLRPFSRFPFCSVLAPVLHVLPHYGRSDLIAYSCALCSHTRYNHRFSNIHASAKSRLFVLLAQQRGGHPIIAARYPAIARNGLDSRPIRKHRIVRRTEQPLGPRNRNRK